MNDQEHNDGESQTHSVDDPPEIDGQESVENLDLWNEVPGGWEPGVGDPEETSDCEPGDHEGRPAFVFVLGSYGDKAIQTKVCTE